MKNPNQLEILKPFFSVMSEAQYDRYENMLLGMDAEPFTDDEIAGLKEKYKQRQASYDLLTQTVNNNNLGAIAEKCGATDRAISIYEENIKLRYRASRSYERLMIIYRRLKRYEDELRVIAVALEVYKNDLNLTLIWESRKVKAQSLLSKSQLMGQP